MRRVTSGLMNKFQFESKGAELNYLRLLFGVSVAPLPSALLKGLELK